MKPYAAPKLERPSEAGERVIKQLHSDRRLKRNIRPVGGALTRLRQLGS